MTTATDPLLDDSDLTVDSDIQVELASARIRAYCRWHIYPNITETVTLDGPGQRFAMLPSLHVTAVNTVTEDATLLLDTEYEWSATGQLWKPSPWTGHFRGLVVNFAHGYDALPEGLRDVVISVATRMPAQLAGATQQTAGGVSLSYGGLLSGAASVSAAFTASELIELDQYRIQGRP